MTIHILIEVKARELEGRSLVAFRAALAGHQVFIGRVYQVLEGIEQGVIPAGVCFEKSISAADEDKLKYRLESGNNIVSQDEESGILSSSYEGFLNLRSSRATLGMADAVFCWGQHDADAWRRRYPDLNFKIHLTGSPRVDFWKKDFDPYFANDVVELRKKYGKYILVVSNFAMANGVIDQEEMVRRAWEDGRVNCVAEELGFRNLIGDDVRMFGEFTVLLRRLSSDFKDLNFVVRPHPAERMEPWMQALSDLGNVHICFEGGISGWVRGSLAVLHNGCTTALETYVTGVPALAYTPFESERNREIPNQLSVCASDQNEISDLIHRLLAGEKVSAKSKDNDSLVFSRLVNATGQSAADGIVRILSSLTSNGGDMPRWLRAKCLDYKYRFRGFVRKKILRRFNKMDRKFPGLSRQELISIRDRLACCDAQFRDCLVTHVYGDVFMIERKK